MREKSAYQITRYLHTNQRSLLSEINKFILKYHWNIKKDFDTLKTHGKGSQNYFERKTIEVPEIDERLSYLETFILLYYFYFLILSGSYNNNPININNVKFWNVLFNNTTLRELEEVYENYIKFLPNIYNTELYTHTGINNLGGGRTYHSYTDVTKYYDLKSKIFKFKSFRPIVIADEDTVYLIHRLSKPYSHSKKIFILRSDIYGTTTQIIASITNPQNYYLYDAFITNINDKKIIKLIFKDFDSQNYKYCDVQISNSNVSEFYDIEYGIFNNLNIEKVYQNYGKYRAVLTSSQNCNSLKLHILEKDNINIFRTTNLPQQIYNPNSDPFTLDFVLSDEFVFIINWTKLTYGIYKFYYDVWEIGRLEEVQSIEDIKVFVFPDTKNKIKIIVNYDCGIRNAIRSLEQSEEDVEIIDDEGLVFIGDYGEQADDYSPYFHEGLVLVENAEVCERLPEIPFNQFLNEIKQKIDTICKKINSSLNYQFFIWENNFNKNSTKVYEIEVIRNANHVVRELPKKEYYIELSKDLFYKHSSIMPAKFNSVAFLNSYGTGVKVYESFYLYNITVFSSKMYSDEIYYTSTIPYNCSNIRDMEQVDTIRKKVCYYNNLFNDYFVFNNRDQENLQTTITKYNQTIVENHYDIFYSFNNIDRLKNHIIRYLMPSLYEYIHRLNPREIILSILISLSQHLGVSFTSLLFLSRENIEKLLNALIKFLFPIHSRIVKGLLSYVIDERPPNTVAIDDYFLSVISVEIYDFISLSDSL